jgi:hypothetical protein
MIDYEKFILLEGWNVFYSKKNKFKDPTTLEVLTFAFLHVIWCLRRIIGD